MTAKIKASSDGLKVTIGNAAEAALEINQTTKLITGINGYNLNVPAPSPGPAFSAKRATSDQSVTSGVFTKVALNSELFDTNNAFNTTNNRFTPQVAGYYQVNGSLCGRGTTVSAIEVAIHKNGAWLISGNINGGEQIPTVSTLVYMNGTTDYLELWGLIAATASPRFVIDYTQMSAFLARLP